MRMPVRSKHTHYFLFRFFDNLFVKIVFDNHKIECCAENRHNSKLTEGNASALCQKSNKLKVAVNEEMLNLPADNYAVPNCRHKHCKKRIFADLDLSQKIQTRRLKVQKKPIKKQKDIFLLLMRSNGIHQIKMMIRQQMEMA